uniref:hypothetical protein n=1 Tax=Marinobacterium profundum TaxID=1714300 RepID=UPI000A985DF7|nr:hypothetical protein [Marinobacterium profundum]
MSTVIRTLLLASLLALMPIAHANEATRLKLHSSIAQTRPEAQQVEHFARLVPFHREND